MASIINASTSSGLVSTADTSGILQLQSNGTTIATISSTGLSTQVGAPAFSAYKSSSQNISSATWTKVTLDLELFDTNNNFASSRFTPTVAGYYQINAGVALSNTTNYMISGATGVYKNGALYLRSTANFSSQGALFNDVLFNASSIIYMNGTTDYLELYAYENAGGTPQVIGNSDTYQTYFSGALIRSA